jgi:hypothetical protein
MRDLEHYSIGAKDGIIGKVKDFYFDDDVWVIRYLVVDTGESPTGRKVLISPIAIGEPNWSERIFPSMLTRNQVKSSPDIDTDKPVSRRQEMGYASYFGYGHYWGGGGLWGAGIYPDILQAGRQAMIAGADAAKNRHEDSHLRSGNEIMRYYVHASDGDIGHVEGLLVDERSWAIRYVIVNTSNWWLGHKVLIAPEWIDYVSWAECNVSVGLTRQAIKDSPAYDAATSVTREQEERIHAHYGRPGYWPREAEIERNESVV